MNYLKYLMGSWDPLREPLRHGKKHEVFPYKYLGLKRK